MRRTLVITGTAALALTALVGCSSSSEEAVGGTTECTEEVLSTAAQEYATSLGVDNLYTFEGLQCADGWAEVTGILGPKNPPADGPMGAPTTIIFEQEGQFWVPKQPEDVCGTPYPSTDGSRPADAQVPEALFETACLTI